MAVEQGFSKAQTDNLPNISEEMIIDFFKENLAFLSTEIKGVKAEKSARSSYSDNAVGYVQLKRDGDICKVKGRMTPEHNVRKKAYGVALECNEINQTLLSVQCDGCAAHQGGCKHAIAFLFWVHRKCSLPSTTETQCYWKKSSLSCVGTSQKFIYASQMGKKIIKQLPPKNPLPVQEFMALLEDKGIHDLQLCNNFRSTALKENLSLHILKMNFEENFDSTTQQFLQYIEEKMTSDLCREAEAASVKQAKSSEWHELRYGRITASKMHEASKCKTLDGSLVESILGAKFKITSAIKRGRILEEDVIDEIKKRHRVAIFPSGFILNSRYPFSGASPDGINKDFVVEVKCPSTETTMEKYLKNGSPSDKHYAQIQIQMLFAKKKKGLFCIAHPDFETSKLITEVWVDFNEHYCNELILKSKEFWISAIYPRL